MQVAPKALEAVFKPTPADFNSLQHLSCLVLLTDLKPLPVAPEPLPASLKPLKTTTKPLQIAPKPHQDAPKPLPAAPDPLWHLSCLTLLTAPKPLPAAPESLQATVGSLQAALLHISGLVGLTAPEPRQLLQSSR